MMNDNAKPTAGYRIISSIRSTRRPVVVTNQMVYAAEAAEANWEGFGWDQYYATIYRAMHTARPLSEGPV